MTNLAALSGVEEFLDGGEQEPKEIINFMNTGIVFGKRYPLVIDSSSGESTRLTTLQYVFKPSSIDTKKPGSFNLSDSNEANIVLPTVGKIGSGNETERFKGAATKPSHECVLLFQGDHFELAKVSTAIVNIRHNQNEIIFKTQDETASKAKKYLEKTLLLRAGPKTAPKRKRVSKKDVQLDNCNDQGSNVVNSAENIYVSKKQKSVDKIKRMFSIVQHDNNDDDKVSSSDNTVTVGDKTIHLPIAS